VKRRQRVYGPPLGKRFVIFLDDVSRDTAHIFAAATATGAAEKRCADADCLCAPFLFFAAGSALLDF